jgi:hypothetical protein
MRAPRMHRLAAALPVAAVAAALVVGSVQAHILKDFGPYSVALGWVKEPTYVGQINAVQVVIKDTKGKPVADLAAGDLKVVVTAGGQSSAALDLVPMYDEDTGLGVQGDYEASLVPTVPGDYTFHLTGTIHGTAVDETATSSDSTFNAASNSTAVEFPAKLPTITEITTRLDRLDSRLAAAASAAPADTSAIDAASSAAAAAQTTAGSAQSTATAASSAAASAQAAANQARDAASTGLTVGIVVGGLGIILGAAGLFAATRRRTASGA